MPGNTALCRGKRPYNSAQPRISRHEFGRGALPAEGEQGSAEFGELERNADELADAVRGVPQERSEAGVGEQHEQEDEPELTDRFERTDDRLWEEGRQDAKSIQPRHGQQVQQRSRHLEQRKERQPHGQAGPRIEDPGAQRDPQQCRSGQVCKRSSERHERPHLG